MAEIPAQVFFNYFVYLFIPFIIAYVLKKNKISPIIGYIVGGIIINNLLNGVVSKDAINSFAYFGIMLLLFTLGLEIQFDRLLALKKFIIIGGLIQLLFTIILITLLGFLFQFSLIQSFLIGIALSASSTSLVAKIIQDRGEENSLLGEVTLGLLMFQDLAFIPFMIIFTSITSNNASFLDVSGKIAIGTLSSVVILLLISYFGQKIVPFIFDKVARTSRELLNIFIILFIFLMAYISTLLHIPILISIFIAGILISQTSEHYHIFTQIRPLRDILAVIFFIFIGMSVNVGMVFPYLPKIIAFTALIIVIKAVVIFATFIFLRFNSRLSFYIATFLFQIDEDAFILMSLAYMNKIFSQEQYLFIISAVLLSLVITPFLINKKEGYYSGIRNFFKKYLPPLDKLIKHRIDSNQSPIDVLTIKDHVIICGYGRIGRNIGKALMLANINFIAIDYNIQTVESAKREGINIIYGDPTDIDILDYAECENAKILISVVPERYSQEMIILNAKKLNPHIFIFTRAHHQADQIRMRDLGVHVVVHPEFEASLSIIRKIFLWKGMEKEEINQKIKAIKLENGMV